MDFTTELSSMFPFPSLCDRLTRCLRIHTGLAEEGITGWRGFQSHARHKAFVNKLPCYFWGNMTHTTVELIQDRYYSLGLRPHTHRPAL